MRETDPLDRDRKFSYTTPKKRKSGYSTKMGEIRNTIKSLESKMNMFSEAKYQNDAELTISQNGEA
jgi:hypothetical protein